jgi:hypothetical protein
MLIILHFPTHFNKLLNKGQLTQHFPLSKHTLKIYLRISFMYAMKLSIKLKLNGQIMDVVYIMKLFIFILATVRRSFMNI